MMIVWAWCAYWSRTALASSSERRTPSSRRRVSASPSCTRADPASATADAPAMSRTSAPKPSASRREVPRPCAIRIPSLAGPATACSWRTADRIGRSMIDAAERAGDVGSHQPRLVEATAGNTGLGLALVAARKGYRLTLVIPDKMSQEKVFHLRAFGAEVVMTRSDVGKGHADYYQDRAEKIAKETPGALYVNQFGNPANPHAHE